MSNKSTATLPRLSSKKIEFEQLRPGQQELCEYLGREIPRHLRKTSEGPLIVPIQWPGGYGKSIGIALALRAALEAGLCQRLLIVVANDTQQAQMIADFESDCRHFAGLEIGRPWKFQRDVATLRTSRKSSACVYVASIQLVQSCFRSGIENNILSLLMDGHDWMIAADEFHHYAEDRPQGEALKQLVKESRFALATSATPYRNGTSTIFGEAILQVNYKDAYWTKERDSTGDGCLKPMLARSYNYQIEAVGKSGSVQRFTTDELRNEVESVRTSPREKIGTLIEVYETKKSLRYSTEYLLPILTAPLTRLIKNRTRHDLPFQCLIRAMTCSHAEAIAKQIKGITDLSVDWIGSSGSESGRTDEENREVRARFCPPKDKKTGKRPKPSLDILVQVAMAGEGFDTVYVNEIIDLAIVNLQGACTTTKQFYLRGSRLIAEAKDLPLFVNIPSDHPLAKHQNIIMGWMDEPDTKKLPELPDDETQDGDWESKEWPDPPEDPREKVIQKAELIDVRQDQLQRAKEVYADHAKIHVDQISDRDAAALYRKMSSCASAEQQNELSREEWKAAIEKNRKAINTMGWGLVRSGHLAQSHCRGIKHRLNQASAAKFGKIDTLTIEELRDVKHWFDDLYLECRDGSWPAWL